MRSNPLWLRQTINFAWTIYKANFVIFTVCVLTFLTLWVILELIVIAGQRFGFLLWAVAHVSFFVVFAGLEVGFSQICLALHDGKQVRYTDIFRELRLGVNFLFIQSIYFGMVLVGLMLLVIPGAYLGTRYTFYAFSFAEGIPNLKQSFQQSKILSQNSMWFLFYFSLFIMFFNIAGASMLGLGLIITTPLSVLMKTFIYRQLMDSHSNPREHV